MNNKILLAAVFEESASFQFEELGICSIASFLRAHGYEVMLMEVSEERMDYNRIRTYGPGIVGVTVYNGNKDAVYRFCRRVRKEMPGVPICAGGYFATYCTREMMREAPCVDFIIRGEGELPFLELVKRLESSRDLSGIKGLVYRKGGEIAVNEEREFIKDLNSLPFPGRDIFHANRLTFTLVSTSRGCTGNCSFCVARDFWKKWRGRDIPVVLEEIKGLYGQGIRFINFIDNTFEDPGPDCTRLKTLARGIIEQGLEIAYSADFRAEFHRKANDELMDLLKRSGLRAAMVGIEAGNEADLRLYGKRATLDDNHKIINYFRNHGMFVKIGFMNFNPYSSFEKLKENIDYLETYRFATDFEIVISRYNAYPGPRLYDKVKADGLLLGESGGDGKNIYGYDFLDRRITSFFDYISGYFNLLDSYGDCLNIVVFYQRLYPMILCNFKVNFENNPVHARAYEVVAEHEKKIEAIFKGLNRSIAQWFRQLLDLCEEGWDSKKAGEITAHRLSHNYFRGIAADLEKEKGRFFFKFMPLGQEYQSLLLKTLNVVSG